MKRVNWLIIFVLLFAGCVRKPQPAEKQVIFLNNIPVNRIDFPVKDAGEMVPQAIVLHTSTGKGFEECIKELKKMGAKVHFIVDEDTKIYMLSESPAKKVRALTRIDRYAVHVLLIQQNNILENKSQIDIASRLVKAIAEIYKIPKSNFDVEGKRGIFSHTQVKYCFGGLRRFERQGEFEPHEDVVKSIIENAGGTFYNHKKWKNGFSDRWCVRKPRAKKVTFDKGLGLTPTPQAGLKSVEQDVYGYIIEERRLRYKNRGKMKKITGVVLHFTYTKSYWQTVRALEQRGLCATIIVDKDGKAYQVLDSIEDISAAACGTNDSCIQIEIVGMGEDELINNKKQFEKVKEVVNEICEKYKIPKNNYDIKSRYGIFSHGQAKKYFGGSAWMWGSEFDPGEDYMRLVIEGIGGRYYKESAWKDRTSDDWAILFHEWLP